MSHVEHYDQKDILGYRGERVYCESCKTGSMWLLLYEIKTQPRQRIPKDEEEKILKIIQQHIMNFPDHNVSIVRMKA